MNIQSDCLCCLPSKLLGLARAYNLDENECLQVVRELHKSNFLDFKSDSSLAQRCAGIYRLLDTISDLSVDRKVLQKTKVSIGMQILSAHVLPGLESVVDFTERLRYLAKWVIAGDSLSYTEFSPKTNESRVLEWSQDTLQEIPKVFSAGLLQDNTSDFLQTLQSARQAVFIHNPLSEMATDMVLIGEMRRHCDRITSLIIGDSQEEAEMIGLDQVSTEILPVKSSRPGILFSEIPGNIHEILMESDLILSKGISNWYELNFSSEMPIDKQVFFLMHASCFPISSFYGETCRKSNLFVQKKAFLKNEE